MSQDERETSVAAGGWRARSRGPQEAGCSRALPCILDGNRHYSRRPCGRGPRLPGSRLDHGCRRGSWSSFPGLRRSTLVDSGSSWGSITRGWQFGAPKLRAADYLGRLAQLVRAPSSHGGGHWFESSVAHFYLFAGARHAPQERCGRVRASFGSRRPTSAYFRDDRFRIDCHFLVSFVPDFSGRQRFTETVWNKGTRVIASEDDVTSPNANPFDDPGSCSLRSRTCSIYGRNIAVSACP